MREYTFKPTELRRAQVWTIRDGHLLLRGADQAIKLADVNEASWGRLAYRGTQSQWLELGRSGSFTKIECNMIGGEDLSEFEALIAAIAAELQEDRPDLKIRLESPGPASTAFLILCSLFAVVGLVMIWLGFQNVESGGLIYAAFGLGLSILMGLTAYKLGPGGQKAYLSPLQLAEQLRTPG